MSADPTDEEGGGGREGGPTVRSDLSMVLDFLRVRKLWWMSPIIVLLLALSLLVVLVEGSALAPFIYTLF